MIKTRLTYIEQLEVIAHCSKELLILDADGLRMDSHRAKARLADELLTLNRLREQFCHACLYPMYKIDGCEAETCPHDSGVSSER